MPDLPELPDLPAAAGSPEAMIAAFWQSASVLSALEGPELRLAAGNRTLTAVLGPRALGSPLREAFADFADQQVFEAFERCYATGRPEDAREWRIQHLGLDGELHETYFDFGFRPWRHDDGRIRGVVAFASDVTASVLARRAAEAARDSAQDDLLEAREVVQVLQGSLLPRSLPVLPRLDVAARYLFAVEQSAAGGDWFDTVVRPDGRVALVVGDVVGHGTEASATMGMLRAVCHERLSAAAGLGEALRDVDRFARDAAGARAATLCVVELDPETGEGRYCTAGHPPPLVVQHGEAGYLPPSGGAPLGTTGELPLLPLSLDDPEALVVLYTDGLLERPGVPLAASTVELSDTVAAVAAGRGPVVGAPDRTVERVCELAVEMLVRSGGYADDLTVLTAQRTAPRAPLVLSGAAQPAAVPEVRAAVVSWLDSLSPHVDDRVAVTHAVTELVANVVEHAYPASRALGEESDDDLELTVALGSDGVVRLRVVDHGTWREPTDDEGRGLAMSSALLDALRLVPGPHGTVAEGERRLSRPAQLLGGLDSAPPDVAHEPPFAMTTSPGPGGSETLLVSGAVLPEDAEELAAELRHRAGAGTGSTVVDLSAVTHLGSAAVRVLHDGISPGPDVVLRLVAPPGSVADQVLSVAQVPHGS